MATSYQNEYDFYVISDDEDWENKVIIELQKRRQGLRCYSRRDHIPGKPKLQNFIDGVNKCKKVVIGFTSTSSTGYLMFVTESTVQKMGDNNIIGKLIPVKITQDAIIPDILNIFSPANGWEDSFYDTLLDGEKIEKLSRKINKSTWKTIGALLGFSEEDLNFIDNPLLHNPSFEMLRMLKDKMDADDFSAIIDALASSKEEEIPAEILVRGPNASKAFKAAIKEGKSDFNLVKLMVMGQENVGKTCLINSLLGKKFNDKHIITEVIAMKKTLTFDEADNTKWTEKEIDHKDEIKDKHETAVATETAEDIQKQKVALSLEYTGERSQTNSSKTLGPIGDQKKKNSNDDASGNEEAEQSETSQATTSASPMKDKVQPKMIDANVREKIIQILKGEPIRDNSLRIWDYGGQLIYHSIHRFYMIPKSIFVIVFNIADDLDDYTIVIDSSGNEHKYYMTNLEYLLYWIRSAYTYTRDDVRGHCEKNFPVFIIVGTHRNSPAKSGDDVNVEDKFEKILKALEDKVYESHVHPEIFAVENKLSSSDENFNELKKVILEIKDEMKNHIPNTWLKLLIEIQKLSEVALPLEQVKSMARECGILDDQTIDVAITYLSDVGEIMYHPTEEALKYIVVTQPMEIVEYFKTVFTIIEKKKRKRDLKKHWRKLEKGVLTKHLLKHLWEQFPIFQNDPNEKMFNFFVNLMTKFGLICPKKNENTDSDGIAYYAVSHLPPQRYVEDPKDDQVNDKVSIFHDFCDFLPDHLFHVAVTKFIEKFQVVNGFETELAYEHAKLSVDDHHYVRIAVATINHRRMFKTTIVRRQQPNAACVMELVPETCKKVLSFLESVLEDLCSSARGIKYQMCIPCREKRQCMHNLENLNKDIVVCGDFQISIERYCRLFGDSSSTNYPSEQIAIQDSSSTNYPSEQIAIQGMTDMQFNTLKMDVSTWYDDHKCLTMLKVLFRDHVDKVTLSGISNTMKLLNDLVTHNHLHSENLAILYDTIIITKHFGLQRKIKLPLFLDLKEGTILEEFTLHRQKLMKCGMNLTLENVTKIDELLNTPCKGYTDVWSMIIDLEDREKISEKNMKVFIDILKLLKIYPALNALQDLAAPPDATQPVVAPGPPPPTQSSDAMTRSSDWI